MTGTSPDASVVDTSVWQLACPGILRSHANRTTPLLGQGRIVDDQPGTVTANLFIGFSRKRRLERFFIPHAASNEMMQTVIADTTIASGHRLDALAIPRADQSRNISRTHPPARFVPRGPYKRGQPRIQFATPIRSHRQPPEKLALYESPESLIGNPKNKTINKISQSSVRVC